MDRNKLKVAFESGLKNIEMSFDKIGMTGGVGHGRFVKDQKSNFKSKEEFFKEIMLRPDRPESSIGTNVPWSEKTDFSECIEGLQTAESSQNEMVN